ncbi:hypothetical protein MSAN_00948800 [Mycena sanguinolenta]|uniref:Uncharacterized protein n=1 Tax=Mycena sanguinolenta TaxID=230812 RepID=A0A8H6YY17_9AGAR|nr:hypothetical protein MSAN_00948800 [Mycena sanguinolenta]
MSYPFLLSQRSISQQRDMFLFCFEEYPIVLMGGGWNLKHHHMTIKTFYRWLDIIDDHHRDRNINFQLQKINLKRFDVLRYIVDSSEGPLLPRDSEELLEPGVYGPFLDGQPYRGQVGDRYCLDTLRTFERGAGCLGEDTGVDLNHHNKMPQAIIDAVTQRDSGVCCVTGRADLPASIIWVFPPSMAYESYQVRDGSKQGLHEVYRCLENAITLCDALVEPYMENMFSIDMEDSGRIITFVDLCMKIPSAPSLPSHLPHHSASHMFWQLHFKLTLGVHFLGGDIEFEEHNPNPQELMDELVEEEANFQDSKWQSGVGAEVLAEFLDQRMCIGQNRTRFNDQPDGVDMNDVDLTSSNSDSEDDVSYSEVGESLYEE